MTASKPNGTGADHPEPIEEEEQPHSAAPARAQLISIRLPVAMLEQLKAAATRLQFNGYQKLVKHILKNWLDGDGDGAPALESLENVEVGFDEEHIRKWKESQPRTRPQLLKLLTEAIRRQEEAAKRGAHDEVELLGKEIEGIRDELADLEHSGEF